MTETIGDGTQMLETLQSIEPLDSLDSVESFDLTPITEALAIIDRSLGEISDRQLVPTGEVADLLLDVRMLLTRVDGPASVN